MLITLKVLAFPFAAAAIGLADSVASASSVNSFPHQLKTFLGSADLSVAGGPIAVVLII